MKGGNYLALEAVRQLMRAGVETPLPVTFLFTSDEEVGSPSTRDLIEAEAARHRYVLVPEPGRLDGSVVTRPLCDRALQPRSHRAAEPCGLAPRRRPLRDPRAWRARSSRSRR